MGSAAKTHSRVWLEIRLGTLAENYRRIARAVAPCSVIAVLKANAYGLGVDRIARKLARNGAGAFGVAEPAEALALRHLGLPVQILGSILPEEIPAAVAAGITLPITDLDTARRMSRTAAKAETDCRCHFLIDTGMGRLGILAEEARDTIREVAGLPHLLCEGIYSHFPMAYSGSSDYTREQIDRFKQLLCELEEDGITFHVRHIANSDAINNVPETYAAPFNAVRTGINLHGAFDNEGRHVLDLTSVFTLKTRLTAVRRLRAGTCIGYGCTYRLPRDTVVGTVSAGYADGLPLALSNRGYLLVHGKPCPVLGRVSMDYTTVSLDQVPEAACADEVVCLGGSGPHAVSVEDWVHLKGTHAYEVICSFGTRVERRFVE